MDDGEVGEGVLEGVTTATFGADETNCTFGVELAGGAGDDATAGSVLSATRPVLLESSVLTVITLADESVRAMLTEPVGRKAR